PRHHPRRLPLGRPPTRTARTLTPRTRRRPDRLHSHTAALPRPPPLPNHRRTLRHPLRPRPAPAPPHRLHPERPTSMPMTTTHPTTPTPHPPHPTSPPPGERPTLTGDDALP